MEQFGRYILLRRLAEGGMGEVYLAQQPGIAGFAKQLVVKRIRPALAGDPTFVEMFLNEGRVAALIDHPNVVHIYELGEIDGLYFIAMEYVPGRSVAEVLQMTGDALELSTALYVTNNACEGLAFAHDAVQLDGEPLGLVHRDVSPPNILIGYSGAVKVSDFGIAKVRHQHQTAAGELKGKFAYLSPEQARGEELDRRSDIFALGLVLFEMTVGQRANAATTDTGMVFAASRGELLDPREVLPDYPEHLARIYARATALDPDERYQHVKEMQADLLAYQTEEQLIVSAGRVGEWLRELDGSRDEANGTADALSSAFEATPEAEEKPPEYAPTVRAIPDGGSPAVLEVDLEQEIAPWRDSMPERRRGRGPLAAALVLLPLLVLGGWLLLRGDSAEEQLPVHDAAVPDSAPPPRAARRKRPRRPDARPPADAIRIGAPDSGGPPTKTRPRRRYRPRPAPPRIDDPPPDVPAPPPPEDDGVPVVPGPSPLAPAPGGTAPDQPAPAPTTRPAK